MGRMATIFMNIQICISLPSINKQRETEIYIIEIHHSNSDYVYLCIVYLFYVDHSKFSFSGSSIIAVWSPEQATIKHQMIHPKLTLLVCLQLFNSNDGLLADPFLTTQQNPQVSQQTSIDQWMRCFHADLGLKIVYPPQLMLHHFGHPMVSSISGHFWRNTFGKIKALIHSARSSGSV